MTEILIVSMATLFIVGSIVVARLCSIRDDTQMHRFLDKRYERINRGLFFLRRDEFINKRSILEFSVSGLLILALVTFNVSFLGSEQLFGIRGITSMILLICAGMIIGDSIVACQFLTKLGVKEYKPEAEQIASCNH